LFDPFNREFILDQHLIDIFAKQFLFYTLKNQSNNNLNAHLQSLNSIALTSSLNSSIALVVADASIKNHVAVMIDASWRQHGQG